MPRSRQEAEPHVHGPFSRGSRPTFRLGYGKRYFQAAVLSGQVSLPEPHSGTDDGVDR